MSPSTPPARLPSLWEQQRRFVTAQHLMATHAVPSLQQWRPSTQTEPQPQPQPQPPTQAQAVRRGDTGTARNIPSETQKRRRQRSPVRAASISETVNRKLTPTPRKTTYQHEKEDRRQLTMEVRELEERLDQLRRHAGLPTKADRRQLLQVRERNAEIDRQIYASSKLEVQLQSLVSEQLQKPPVNPLYTYIHLPRDQTQRRAILQSMKNLKVRRAAEVGVAYFKPLEGNCSFKKEERFMADDGVYHCHHWEMNEFPQFKTAKQLYDTLLFWLYNVEIGITEVIGRLTLRGDNSEDEPTIWHQLLLSTSEEDGYTEEFNYVTFAQFYPTCELLDGESLGVIAVDTVDVDDLYPYQPHERTKKLFQVYHLINEVVVDTATARRAAVLKSCVLNAQLPAQFPMEPRVVKKIHENMSAWAAVMVQFLRDYVVPP